MRILLAAVVLAIGCSNNSNSVVRKPHIGVTKLGDSIEINYYSHDRIYNGRFTEGSRAVLSAPEEIVEYKRQVKMLLEVLEDANKK